MAGAAASSMAAAAVGAGTNMAGGASALNAAFRAAQQSMSAGGAEVGDKQGMGSGLGGTLASAMGNAGRTAVSMGQHLAQGVGEIAKEKMGSMKEAAQDKIAATLGGQVAQTISTKSGASTSGEDSQNGTQSARHDSMLAAQFEGDSLGAGMNEQTGTGQGGQQDEVAQFVAQSRSKDKGDE